MKFYSKMELKAFKFYTQRKKILSISLSSYRKCTLAAKIQLVIQRTNGTLCEAAYTAEATTMSKEINDDSKVNAVIAGMSLHEKQQDRDIAMTK